MKTLVIIWIFWIGIVTVINAVDITDRPTRAETIAICDTICDSIIKANSNTIFDKKNVGKLENCLYTLIEIERNQIPIQSLSNINVWKMRQRLELHLQWLKDRNEQRIEEAREKFKE